MPIELELQMAEAFRDAVEETIVRELRNDADWARFKEIKQTAIEDRRKEEADFKRDKPQLLAEARKKLIDEAGSRTLEHPTPFGTDRFSKEANDRRAHEIVETEHQTRLLAITETETKGYEALEAEIHEREGLEQRPTRAFARSTDRRSGPDRRTSQDRRGPSRNP